MNRLRPRWRLAASGSLRASSMSTSARAPNVHHVLTPLITKPGSPSGPAASVAVTLTPADVAAEVGLGDRHGGHHLGAGQLRQPVQLLGLRAALDQGTGEDLRAGDQRAADAERATAELLGGDHHAHVLAVAALVEPLVVGRHAEAERAHLGEAADDLLGHVLVEPVDVLGARLDDLVGEGAERVLDHLEVGVEVARARAGRRTRRRTSGVRNVARNGWASRSGAGSRPHSSSRPHSRVIRSWTISAANAQASRPSISPLAP